LLNSCFLKIKTLLIGIAQIKIKNIHLSGLRKDWQSTLTPRGVKSGLEMLKMNPRETRRCQEVLETPGEAKNKGKSKDWPRFKGAASLDLVSQWKGQGLGESRERSRYCVNQGRGQKIG
jgi:hypothetical protein